MYILYVSFAGAKCTTSGCSAKLVHSDGRIRLLNDNKKLPDDKPLTDQTLQLCQYIEQCNNKCKAFDKAVSSVNNEELFPAVIGRYT